MKSGLPAQSQRPKTVVYLSLYANMGGGEISLLNLMMHLDRERYVPVLIVPAHGPLAAKAEAAGIKTSVIPFPVVPLRDLANPRRLSALWRAGRALARVIAAERADIIQCSDLLGLLVLVPFLLNNPIPVLYSVIFFYEHSRAALFNLLAPLFVRRIVTPSRAVGDDLRAKTAAINDMISVCYNGVDRAIFRPLSGIERAAARKRFRLPDDKILVGCIGRYDLWKGHATFLDALTEVVYTRPDVHGVIAGGAMTGEIFPSVERYKMKVVRRALPLVESGHLSILDHTDAPEELIGCLDLFVCPSDREPFGLVVPEAYAAGIPIVASTTVGALEVMENAPNVYTAPPRDKQSFADAMLAALQALPGESERAAMHERMAALTWKSYAEGFQEQYDAIARDEAHTTH